MYNEIDCPRGEWAILFKSPLYHLKNEQRKKPKKSFEFSTYWLTCCICEQLIWIPAEGGGVAFNAFPRPQNDCSCWIPLVLLYIKRKYEKILANILSIMQLKTKRKQTPENERKHPEKHWSPGLPPDLVGLQWVPWQWILGKVCCYRKGEKLYNKFKKPCSKRLERRYDNHITHTPCPQRILAGF